LGIHAFDGVDHFYKTYVSENVITRHDILTDILGGEKTISNNFFI